MLEEEWRAVAGHPDYEVSNLGRVRSLDRIRVYSRVDQYTGKTISVTRHHQGRVLSAGTMKSGHQVVALGRGRTLLVHRLVLEAFVGTAPADTECCHRDDDPANNNLKNLRWDTRSANIADYYRNHGRHQQRKPSHA